MSFLSPLWLAGVLIVPVYLIAARRSRWKVGVGAFGLLAVIVFALAALARPVIPQKPITTEQAGSDVILAVDLSYSMRAGDVSPSRLAAAKSLLRGLVRSDTTDRFGVIGFTTSAIVLSPLTRDTELLEHLFGALDESQIITKGTQVMSALELARKMSHARNPVVILLTDGGDEIAYDKEAEFVRDSGLKVSIVMLASAMGSTIPSEGGESLRDEKGHIVVTSRNDAIGAIAEAAGGRIIEGADADALRRLVESARRDDFSGKSTVMRYEELFVWPLAAAIAAFVAAFTRIGQRIFPRLMVLLALIGVSAEAGMADFAYLYLAKRTYDEAGYERSASLYAHVDSPQARYNRANALYKAGKYEAALGIYSAIRSDDPAFKARLYYNMGNCFIRLQKFVKARESFLKSLTLVYTKEADENLRAIAGVEDPNLSLNVRKEKNDSFQQENAPPAGERKNAKEGGGSNMQSDVASGGGGEDGKKTAGDPRLSTSQAKAQLSSRQYELINQRSVHETKPW